MKQTILAFSLCFLFFHHIAKAQNNDDKNKYKIQEYKSEIDDLEEKVKEQEKQLRKKDSKTPECEGKSKSGITLNLGGGTTYLYGVDNSTNGKFDSDFISWYGSGVLGYTYNSNNKGKGSTIGLFGTVGNSSGKSVEKVFANGEFAELLNPGENRNLFYNMEAGVILFEIFRLSTGVGIQEYTNIGLEKKNFLYYSTTVGLHIPIGAFRIAIDVNQMYGRDLKNTIIRPMAGIYFQL